MTHYDVTRKEFAAQYRQMYPAEHRLFLSFGSCRIEVAANDIRITEALTDYYKGFISDSAEAEIVITVHEAPELVLSYPFAVKTPDPGKTKIKELYFDLPDGRIVRKRLTGMVFAFGEGENIAVGPCLANINQTVNFINNRHIQWALCGRGCLLGHAAGIIWKEKGLSLAGFSGAGKSTLALHIMNLGAAFVSNDRLMIEKDGDQLLMHGVAKLPRINPGTVLNNPNLIKIMPENEKEKFSAMPAEELWQVEHKYDAPIDDCFGPNLFFLEAPMNALAILNWKHGAGEMSVQEVDLAERRELLPAFMKSTGLFFTPDTDCRMPEPTEEEYLAFLSRCNVLEFSGGVDFEKAAEICVNFLETGQL